MYLLIGSGKAAAGEPQNTPDVTLTLSCDDLGELLRGDLSPFSAYMAGRLVVEGDTNLASRLGDLIDIIKSK